MEGTLLNKHPPLFISCWCYDDKFCIKVFELPLEIRYAKFTSVDIEKSIKW